MQSLRVCEIDLTPDLEIRLSLFLLFMSFIPRLFCLELNPIMIEDVPV